MRYLKLNPNTNTGGHRLSNDDIFTLNEALAQVVAAFGESFGSANLGGFLLSGAQMTIQNGQVAVSAGWLYHNQTLWRVPALPATPEDPTKTLYFTYQELPTSLPISYQNGTSRVVHFERVATVVYTRSVPSGTLYTNYAPYASVEPLRLSDLRTLIDANTNHRLLLEQAWTNVSVTSLNNASGPLSSVGSDSYCRYKIVGKQLYLRMQVEVPAGNNLSFSLQYPVGITLPNYPFAINAAVTTSGSGIDLCRVVFQNNEMRFDRYNSDPLIVNFIAFSTVVELA